MDIVCLLGSPRRGGNSDVLAERFLGAAGALGARTRTFALNELSYRGCQGCMACKGKLDRCILDDDLAPVLAAVREADVLAVATPVYFGDVPGQLKCCIDRFYSFLEKDYAKSHTPSRLAPGKRFVCLLAQGYPDERRFADIFPRYEWFLRWMGFRDPVLVRGVGAFAKGDMKKREDLLLQAEEAARRLF